MQNPPPYSPLVTSFVGVEKERCTTMAANKFATVLHKTTNRFVVILVYTFLEWILIVLFLLNSVFSYLIAKFTSFGLQALCLSSLSMDRLMEMKSIVRSAKPMPNGSKLLKKRIILDQR